MKIHKVQTLTRGEQLMLMRRRKKLTQSELGKKFGLSQMSISNYERGKREIPSAFRKTWFAIQIKDLSKGENLHMLRLRLQLNLRVMAAKMGVSHTTYIKMEAGEKVDF